MDEPELFPDQPEPEEHVKKQGPQEDAFQNVSKSVTRLGSRLRVLEEQYTTLRNKSQLTDSNLLDFEKELRNDIKAMNEDVLELKHSVQELKEKLEVIGSEMDNAVKEHEFKVVEKYVDLWDPTRFVTKEQLRENIKEALKRKDD